MLSDTISRFRGDTYPIPFTAKVNGTPIDITGYAFVMSLSTKENPSAADYVWQIGGTIDDTTNGRGHFDLTEQQADQVGNFYYDVQVTDAAGKRHTPRKGRMVFTQDITK